MTLTQRLIFISFLTLFVNTVNARTAIDARIEYESWNTGIEGNANAAVLGLGVTQSIFSVSNISAGITRGDYQFDKNTDSPLIRTDVDIVVSYPLYPQITLFSGYRHTKISYENNQDDTRTFDDNSHGPGIGMAGFQLLNAKWIAYTRMGSSFLFSKIDYTNPNKKDISGKGISFGIEGGIIYQFLASSTAGVALKYQNTAIDYDSEIENWEHNYLRFGLSLSHYF